MLDYIGSGLFSKVGLFDALDETDSIVEVDPCGCPPANGIGLERTRYYARQLVGPDDLTQDQRYFRDKHRRHNRLLHGWGVVCGARVKADPEHDCAVIVEAGYVLGPWGDEIVIPHNVRVDLCKQDLDGNAVSPCGSDTDPWCTDVRVDRPSDEPLYLAVKYAECDSRPVRVTGCGCGCDDSECEYSRTRDSYAIRVLTELPKSHARLSAVGSLYGLLWGFTCVGGRGRTCPPCPDEPWVILADITLADGQVADVDCFAHRRYVASGALYYFQCGGKKGSGSGFDYGMKESTLVDVDALESMEPGGGAPTSTVALRLGDRWTSVPANFSVKRGETVSEFVAREGDRRLVDPQTGNGLSIGELYAAAGVDPSTELGSRADALALLEGRTLDVPGVRAVRGSLDRLLGKEGSTLLNEEHAGVPERAADLPADVLPHPAGYGRLAAHLKGLTVAEVAAEDRDHFVAAAVRGVPKAEKDLAADHAAEVWTRASRIAGLVSAWSESGGEPPKPPDDEPVAR